MYVTCEEANLFKACHHNFKSGELSCALANPQDNDDNLGYQQIKLVKTNVPLLPIEFDSSNLFSSLLSSVPRNLLGVS